MKEQLENLIESIQEKITTIPAIKKIIEEELIEKTKYDIRKSLMPVEEDEVDQEKERAARINHEGIKFLNSEAYREAVSKFEDALKILPDNEVIKRNLSLTYNNYGVHLSDKGLHEEAIECYLQGLEVNPDHYLMHKNLGVSYQQCKRYDESIDEFRIARKKMPDDDKLHNSLGISYLDKYLTKNKLDDCVKALSEFKKAQNLNLQNEVYKQNVMAAQIAIVNHYACLAEEVYCQGKFEESYETAEQGIEFFYKFRVEIPNKRRRDFDNLGCRLHLAMADYYYKKCLPNQASEEMRKFLNLNPNNKMLKFMSHFFEMIYSLAKGMEGEANKEKEKALNILNNNPNIMEEFMESKPDFAELIKEHLYNPDSIINQFLQKDGDYND